MVYVLKEKVLILMNVKIVRAERSDLKEMLDLQYLAYQSEASLFKNKDIHEHSGIGLQEHN